MKIDFEIAAKDIPLNREELAKRIAETPPNIIMEYISGLENAKKVFSENINVLLSGGSPLSLHLLRELNDERVQNIRDIVTVLSDDAVVERVDELIALSYGSKPFVVSEEQKNQHRELVDEVTSLIKQLAKFNVELMAGYFLQLYIRYLRMMRALLFYRDKNKSDLALKRYLGKISEESLEDMIRTAKTELKLFETTS